MKKCEIVKKNNDFNDIIMSCPYYKNKYYCIYYKDNGLKIPKFGLAVSKKCGNAVTRNKIKRQLRAIIDNNKNVILGGYNYIIVVRKIISELKYDQMEEFLINLFKKIDLK